MVVAIVVVVLVVAVIMIKNNNNWINGFICHGRWTYNSVVRESEFKFEEPGFNPLAGQGEEHLF